MVTRMLLTLGVTGIGIYGVLCLALFFGQHRLVYYPDRRIDTTPAEHGLEHRDLWLTSADGIRVHAWYLPAAQDAPVVLFLHGNAGNLSHRMATLRLLSGLGAGVLILSYRGYGLSEGSPDEAGTYLDAAAAYEHLTGTLGIPAQRLVVFGRSLGGAIASWLAAERPCGALILESTFTSVPDIGAAVYPAFPVRTLARIRYDSVSRVHRSNCPVLIVHSRDDRVVPYDHGERLFAAAREPKRFLDIRGGHNDRLMLRDPRYARAIVDVLASLRPG